MKTYRSNRETIEAYLREDLPESRNLEGRNTNGSLRFRQYGNCRVLYSYGEHFPLFLITEYPGSITGNKNGNISFLINENDYYSRTTSRHKSLCKEIFQEFYPTMGFMESDTYTIKQCIRLYA